MLFRSDWNTFNNKQPAGTYVTSISVASSNGLAGTSSGGATPALTLSTTVTGVLKGNGTAISAATAGTDYAPATSGSSILYGNGAGGFSNVTVGSGLSFSAGTLSATAGSTTITVGTTATSGGAAGQIMFDTGTVVQESSGLVWDNTNKALSTLGGGTVTTSNPVINASQTWNAAGVTFTGLKFNVTNTASASASKLIDLQIGGASYFQVFPTTAGYSVSE